MMVDFTRTAMDRRLGQEAVQWARRLNADVVVMDVILTAGIYEVAASGIPTVVFVHCFYRAVQDLAASPVGAALRLRGTPPLALESMDVLQLVTARADLDLVRGMPPVRHVGVVWQGIPRPSTEQSVPQILVSLSTCAFAGQRRMLHSILDAIDGLEAQATLTVGPAIDASGLRVPTNCSVHAWLDHDEVLATASLVVGHGGHSTTMRALSFGVPLVVMPANPLIDQKRVGQSLERAGAGILLGKRATANRIRTAITTVLADSRYQDSAARLGEKIRQRDGAETAADAISEFASVATR
jgi:hypothetical protein